VGAQKAKRQFANGRGRVHLVPCNDEFREAFAGKLGIGNSQRSIAQTALKSGFALHGSPPPNGKFRVSLKLAAPCDAVLFLHQQSDER
jgi:hypothetical protein